MMTRREYLAAAIGPDLWNASLRGPTGTSCSADNPSEALNCFFPETLYHYQTSLDGLWLMNSMYDSEQLTNIIFKVGCDIYSSCSDVQMEAIQQYHVDFYHTVLKAQQSFPLRDGHFLTSCYQNESACRSWDWYGISIGGLTANSSFYNWYSRGSRGGGGGGGGGDGLEIGSFDVNRIDVPWPNDASCAAQSAVHGSC